RHAVSFQPFGYLVLRRPRKDLRRKADPLLALAQAAFYLHVQYDARCDRVLPHPDEPRHRARRPDRDLNAPRVRRPVPATCAAKICRRSSSLELCLGLSVGLLAPASGGLRHRCRKVNEGHAMPFDGNGYEGRIEGLAKMDKVIDLLAREDRWCKQQLRSYDGRRCILGAMMAADATTVLKEPILLAVKQVTGRDYLRIEMFNDHPLTTHTLVLRVLNQAR